MTVFPGNASRNRAGPDGAIRIAAMGPLTLLRLAGLALCPLLAAHLAWADAPQAARSTAADRSAAAVTIYNSNMALVREVRDVQLPGGADGLAWADVSAQIRAETVHVKALDGAPLSVLEQNFRYDVLTPAALVDKFVGRAVELVHVVPGTGEVRRMQATLLSIGEETGAGYGGGYGYAGGTAYADPGSFVYDIGGTITAGGDWRIVLPPELPPGFVSRPTLFWLLDSPVAGRRRIETSYLTWGMNWRADYVLALSADATRGDLTGWVTLTNDAGIAFPGAALQLVAGQVNVEPEQGNDGRVRIVEQAITLETTPAEHGGFVEENLFEYHLYTLQRATDLADREQKQIELLSGSRIPVERHYRLRGTEYGLTSEQSAISEGLHPDVWLEFVNAQAVGLGMPLPAGTVRVYGAEAGVGAGREFLGEDAIPHTPREERVKLRTGTAFDIVADRRQTDYRVLGTDVVETAWEIKLRNRKAEAVTVELREPTSGDWTVVSSSVPWTKESAREIRFDVACPPDREVVVTYRLRVHY